MNTREAHWPSNLQHEMVNGSCWRCGVASPASDGKFYPCGSCAITYFTPHGEIVGGITENGGYAALDWPDGMTAEDADVALETFVRDHYEEIFPDRSRELNRIMN